MYVDCDVTYCHYAHTINEKILIDQIERRKLINDSFCSFVCICVFISFKTKKYDFYSDVHCIGMNMKYVIG